ncbi:hypothetical protein M2372_003224 [Chryseobacterium sp. BIGb0232]|nr:hypothetical protein [Chryseobacterium sp. BIGb0232]
MISEIELDKKKGWRDKSKKKISSRDSTGSAFNRNGL